MTEKTDKKKVNSWVEHVKKYAKEHNISYMCAVAMAKASYKAPEKVKPEGKRAIKEKKEKETIEILEKQPENKDILDNLIKKIVRRKTARTAKELKAIDKALQKAEGYIVDSPYEKFSIQQLEDRIALMLKEPKRFTDYPELIIQEIKPLMDILQKKKAMKKNQQSVKEKTKIKKEKIAKEKETKDLQGLSF